MKNGLHNQFVQDQAKRVKKEIEIKGGDIEQNKSLDKIVKFLRG